MSVWGSIKKGVKGVAKVAKKITKSPLMKVGIVGATLVCPPAGASLAAGVAVASKLSDAATKGTKKQKAAAKKLLTKTAQSAKKGDPDAKRMLKLVAANSAAKKGDPKAKAVVKLAAKAATEVVKKQQTAMVAQGAERVAARFEMLANGRIRKVA